MARETRAWISGDETAATMLARLQALRPAVLFPPLHRVPLRAGNVVEIAGPSPSAKSQVLLQAALHCMLPKEWKGVHFGGLGRAVMYFDLDCRFDVLRLSKALRLRIMEAYARVKNASLWSNPCSQKHDAAVAVVCPFDDELFFACMRRFLYLRCYSTLEFLAALKTNHYYLDKECEALGVGIHFLLIDSIGAFYWIDRAYQPLTLDDTRRKNLSLQSLTETVVDEIHKLSQLHPMLVLATKASIFGAVTTSGDPKRKWSSQDMAEQRSSSGDAEKILYREYMPSAWQSFVTHRIHLRVSERTPNRTGEGSVPIYTSQWVLPQLNHFDRFVIRDDGIHMIS